MYRQPRQHLHENLRGEVFGIVNVVQPAQQVAVKRREIMPIEPSKCFGVVSSRFYKSGFILDDQVYVAFYQVFAFQLRNGHYR